MAYSDGLMWLYGIASGAYALGTVGGEAGTAIEASAADIAAVLIPQSATILAFGAVAVDEDWTGGSPAELITKAITSIDYIAKGVGRAEIAALDLGPTALTGQKRSDGSKRAQDTVLTTGIDENDVFMYVGTALPFRLPAGAHLIFEHKQAADSGGTEVGEYVPFVLLRLDGYDMLSAQIIS
jgi:hypothetical protein